jgi:hypothetical protein
LKHAVDTRDPRPGVKFAVAAAQFCGYSGQQLAGAFRGPAGTWTNTTKYLGAIQLQEPAGAPGFDPAKSMLMQEFAVVIP